MALAAGWLTRFQSPPELIDVRRTFAFFFLYTRLLAFSCSFHSMSLFLCPSLCHRLQTPKVRLNHQKKKKNHYIFYKFPFWGFLYSALRILKRAKKIFIDDLAFLQDGCARCFLFFFQTIHKLATI